MKIRSAFARRKAFRQSARLCEKSLVRPACRTRGDADATATMRERELDRRIMMEEVAVVGSPTQTNFNVFRTPPSSPKAKCLQESGTVIPQERSPVVWPRILQPAPPFYIDGSDEWEEHVE